METIAEADNVDFLLPVPIIDGGFYYLRRPYRQVERVPFWKMFVDFLLIPFRIVRAMQCACVGTTPWPRSRAKRC